MTAKDVFDIGMKRLETFKVEGLLPALQYANDGAVEDVKNIIGCAYYQWATSMVDVLKPKQVVELGGAMGVWSLCVLHTLPTDCHLYSITLEEHGLEFAYIKEKYSNFTPIVGDDLDMSHWKGIDLHKTDLWFFDALHTEKHLRAELDLYSPYFKEGTIVLFDDVRMDELWPVWKDIKKGKYGLTDYYEATSPLHWTGYGIAIK